MRPRMDIVGPFFGRPEYDTFDKKLANAAGKPAVVACCMVVVAVSALKGLERANAKLPAIAVTDGSPSLWTLCPAASLAD